MPKQTFYSNKHQLKKKKQETGFALHLADQLNTLSATPAKSKLMNTQTYKSIVFLKKLSISSAGVSLQKRDALL